MLTFLPFLGISHIGMGTYWWPYLNKEDGLPYIRKDGLNTATALPM